MSNTAQTLAGKRVASLLDESSFVEIGGSITARNTDFNMAQADTPGDGVITGYGLIDGRLVYVYSQDASVLGGTIGEMHAKKIAGIYDLAMKMGAPVIGLIDCAGFRLQEAADALNAFGEVYAKQTLASGVIPQIAAVFGTCGGGLAIAAGLADFTFMEEKGGKLFVNSPNALAGNTKEKCDTASAKFQSGAGNADFVGNEEEIFSGIRALVGMLPSSNDDAAPDADCTDDLNRVCEDLANCAGDTSILLSRIADDQVFIEVKAGCAKEMVTGFLRLNGQTVGAVANRTELYDADGNKAESFDAVLTPLGAEKAAEFVKFCDSFNIPVLSLTNAKGFQADVHSEYGIAKAVAKLIYAFSEATVPKVNVVIGAAYGSAYVAMNSKSIGADVTYAWPDAEIGTMEPSLAAKIMYADSSADVIKEKAAEYAALQTGAASAARRGYVDTVIEASDTRKYVIGAFEMLFTKREDRPAKKHGTV